MEEVGGACSNLQNEEFHDLHCSPNIISGDQFKEDEMGGACSTYGERSTAYRVSAGKMERKRPIGRPKRTWEDTGTDLKETGWKDVQWINLAKDRDMRLVFVNTVMNLRVAQNSVNLLTS